MASYSQDLDTDFIGELATRIGKAFSILSMGPSELSDGSIGTKYKVMIGGRTFNQTFEGTWEERSAAFRKALGEFFK